MYMCMRVHACACWHLCRHVHNSLIHLYVGGCLGWFYFLATGSSRAIHQCVRACGVLTLITMHISKSDTSGQSVYLFKTQIRIHMISIVAEQIHIPTSSEFGSSFSISSSGFVLYFFLTCFLVLSFFIFFNLFILYTNHSSLSHPSTCSTSLPQLSLPTSQEG